MKRALVFLIFILLIIKGQAQSCFPDGITFIQQSEIDNFALNYPNCTEIEGDVWFKSNEIYSLEGVSQITSISGDLIIGSGIGQFNSSLQNLAGLENLVFVGGDVWFMKLSALESLDGFDNLGSELHGSLVLWIVDNLVNLSGLEFVNYIQGDFQIYNSTGFTNFEGLNNLDSIGGSFSCNYNPSFSFQGLENLKKIGFDLKVTDNQEIVNFSGLNSLEYIGNDFWVEDNEGLFNFEGLESLEFIGHDLRVTDYFLDISNFSGLNSLTTIGNSFFAYEMDITDFQGLENLTHIGGDLGISFLPQLLNFHGLENLEVIDAKVDIRWCPLIQDLSEFTSLYSIGGELVIFQNDNLESLSGLSGVDSLNISLEISGNPVLSDIEAIANANVSNLSTIEISDNPSLNSCAIDAFCYYLYYGNEDLLVLNNGVNCSSIEQIIEICDFSPCLEDGFNFTSQEEIDSFNVNEGFCSGIVGDVLISGEDIIDLDGLNGITFIGGEFILIDNPMLADISGLSSLESIGGKLSIENNPLLSSLTGLNNTSSIGGDLIIASNDSLASILPLLSLQSIDGDLKIENNPRLVSIKGIRNIDASGIQNLYINNNLMLSECDYESICNYIGNPNGSINVSNNSTNCSSLEELENACIMVPCLQGGVFFYSQSEIDNFPLSYPNCDVIEGDVNFTSSITGVEGLYNIVEVDGDLVLGDYFSPLNSLSSLTGLDSLVKIEGDLYVSSSSISNLHGLEKLSSVHSIVLKGNYALQSLDGLENIEHLEGDLLIEHPPYNNPYLNDLSGIVNLTKVGGSVSILGTDALTDLSGLANLESIGRGFQLKWNNGLHDLEGLNSLRNIGDFSIEDNLQLEDFSGIFLLDSIKGQLAILDNDVLVNLEGLENLSFIKDGIFIKGNDNLTDLNALNQSNGDSISLIRIYNNPILSICSNELICNYSLLNSGELIVYDNAEGCNSQEEIIFNCDGCYPGGLFLSTQEEINNFPLTSQNCSTIYGDLVISGNSIQNLDSLSAIQSIRGNLIIENNPNLEVLNGLSGLTSIHNNELIIQDNQVLSTISGLGNILDMEFDYLEISNNPSLSECSINSVCSHFMNFGDYLVYNNTGACLSEDEIAIACNLMDEESPFQVFPNPTGDILNVASFVNAPISQITIYDQVGTPLYTTEEEITLLDISSFNAGIYLIEILSDGMLYQELLLVY